MALRVTKLDIDPLIFRMSHPDIFVARFKSFLTCSEEYPRIPGYEVSELSPCS